MKLQTQFTVPKNYLRDLDCNRRIPTLEKNSTHSGKDYPTAEDCLVCCN